MRSAGPFEILEILGEGSFGTVCVARVKADPLRRKVALKILKGLYAQNKKIVKRIRDEHRLLASISHPSIVKVEKFMELNGRPTVVMEHVQGVSLDLLLMRFKTGLPPAIGLEVIRQTALALYAAYAEALDQNGRPLRVIHRDVKPSNIMLSIAGEVKVLDFGIARGDFEGREARTESVVMGSRPYMAPERLDGVTDTWSVDVYSAGMTLYELLTGRPMALSINPTNHDQLMNRHLQYIQIQGMSPVATEDVRDLIRRMCNYHRDYRPTAIDCARDLEQLLYAIDRRYMISIEEFARSTVLPLYESRQRVSPEDSAQQEGGDDFLREVTGAITSGSRTPSPATARTPYMFVGGLSVIVAALALLAVLKWLGITGGIVGTSVSEAGSPVIDDQQVRVEVYIPDGIQAQIGTVVLQHKGAARMPPGPARLELLFDDGRVLFCPFVAADGISVRWVGEDKVSVDDGDAIPCAPGLAPPRPSPM